MTTLSELLLILAILVAVAILFVIRAVRRLRSATDGSEAPEDEEATGPSAKSQEVLVEIHEIKETIREAKFRAVLAKNPADAEKYADELTAELDKLAQGVQPSVSEEELNSIKARAGWIETQRAYIVPTEVIELEAQSQVDEMVDWGIPDEVKRRTSAKLQSLGETVNATEFQRRVLLEQIYTDYNYWDEYLEWYLGEKLVPLSQKFVWLFAIFLTLSLGFFFLDVAVLGFLFAGGAGAALSILLRLPPMSVYGQLVGVEIRMLVRLVVGIAAAATGFGLLATGIFNVGVPTGTPGSMDSLPRIMERCSSGCSLVAVSSFVSDEFSATARWCHRAISRLPAGTPDAVGQDGGGTGGARPPAPHASATNETVSSKCTTAGIMFLLAIGMLLGFSERALSSFESLILPSSSSGSTPPVKEPPIDIVASIRAREAQPEGRPPGATPPNGKPREVKAPPEDKQAPGEPPDKPTQREPGNEEQVPNKDR